jgi:hypothetical protein
VHVQVAADVLNFDQRREAALGGGFDLAPVLAQLGRDPRQVQGAVNLFFRATQDFLVAALKAVEKDPDGTGFTDWFTESWGIQVVCDNGTKRTSDDWVGYEWTIRDGSGRVAFKLHRALRHALAEGDILFWSYAYSDCDLFVEPGVNGGVDPNAAERSRVAPDQPPVVVPPVDGPTLHIVLALDGYGRLQRPDLFAVAEDARCLDGPEGTRCGGGGGAYRDAVGTLVIDDIVFLVDGRLGRLRPWIEPMPVGEIPTP